MTDFHAFWQARHLVTLTTLRPDGTPHVTPVGATLNGDKLWIITSKTSRKVHNIRATPQAAACQVDGRHWSTVEGPATILEDEQSVRAAEAAYTTRYRPPRPNPQRVVIEITITKTLGTIKP